MQHIVLPYTAVRICYRNLFGINLNNTRGDGDLMSAVAALHVTVTVLLYTLYRRHYVHVLSVF